jgi:hypothetical protein
MLLVYARWERLETDAIAGPTWMLDGRTFAAATGAARGSP